MPSRAKPDLLHALFFLSGACGLGFQMAWTRLFGLGLGHELPAVLAVVAAFFGGLALGAWLLDGPISRSEHPGRWYAGLEFTIGGWGFVSVLLVPSVNELALRLFGLEPSALRHWTVAFALPFLALLPATAAMGATLPAMERFLSQVIQGGPCVSTLYAANTAGAVAGTFASAFFLLPLFGFAHTLIGLAALNVAGGLVALALAGNARRPSLEPAGRTITAVSPGRLGVTLFFTGLLGIGYEVVGIRVLGQVLENTVYSFAGTLAVYLLGTALGAGGYRRATRRFPPASVLSWLLLGLGVTCLVGLHSLSQSPRIYHACRGSLGDSPSAVLGAEMLTVASVFFLPTLFMGAIFSLLAQSARREGGGVGRAVAINTLGSALAPLLFGVVLLPLLGAKWTLTVLALGYLLLLPRVAGFQWLGVAAAVVLVGVLPADLRLLQMAPGSRLIAYRAGVMDSVAVVQDLDGHRTLRVNNRFTMGGTGSANAERRHAHIPLLLHPAPRRALFLGAGTGITFGAATAHPDLRAEGVELVPEVADSMGHFEPENARSNWPPRLQLRVADARRFVRATASRYDVVVADLFHPARDGAGALYTREHFQAVRQCLAPAGLFCQWLPLYQLDEPVLRIIIRTFLEVFPHTRAYLLRLNLDTPVLGLIGTLEPLRYAPEYFEHRVGDPALREQLKSLGLADGLQLFGCLAASPRALRDFAGNAVINTDDAPVVMFAAPRFTYRHTTTAYGRLFAVLDRRGAEVGELLREDEAVKPFADRLASYIAARDVYLRGLEADLQGRREQASAAFVQSARLSPDFSTGYAHCLTLAVQQAKTNPPAARALLERLIEAQPERPVARQLLERLFTP